MRIAILGATGATGRLVVAAALERGHEAVALARRPEALADLHHQHFQVATADVARPDTIVAATHDADAVISALGFRRGGPSDTLSRGARAIADAHPPRIVWMGSLGTGASRHRPGPLYDIILRSALRAGYADKAIADEIIAGPDTTIFHPGALTNSPATGHPELVPLGDLTRRWHLMPPRVSRADVAAAMVAEVETLRFAGHTVAIFNARRAPRDPNR